MSMNATHCIYVLYNLFVLSTSNKTTKYLQNFKRDWRHCKASLNDRECKTIQRKSYSKVCQYAIRISVANDIVLYFIQCKKIMYLFFIQLKKVKYYASGASAEK